MSKTSTDVLVLAGHSGVHISFYLSLDLEVDLSTAKMVSPELNFMITHFGLVNNLEVLGPTESHPHIRRNKN